MKNPEKIKIEIEPAKDTILVEMNKGPEKETFRISEDTFRNLFAGRYNTGYFSVSQDGPIYIEERDGVKVVAVQRGLRTDQTIRWDDHRRPVDVKVTTPWTYMIFQLKPSGGGYTRQKEVIFVGSGPSLGAKTPLFSAQFLGNVYETRVPFAGSNICWGNTGVVPNGIVSLGSLTNIVNDFYTQTFTNHIERTTERWLQFTASNKPHGSSLYTLDQVIAGMWG
jgi:hypothetical protein